MILDLEALEAEAKAQSGEPFIFKMKDGTNVELVHPEDLDYKNVVAFDLNSPSSVLPVLMGEDVFKSVVEQGVSIRTLKKVVEEYIQFFGLGTQGEGEGSPRTSTGSAGRSKQISARPKKAKAS